MSTGSEYRDRVYIRKDIILKLAQYGRLTQTALISYCGLNLQKHRWILEDMERKGLILRRDDDTGSRHTTYYAATPQGLDVCRRILEPYEALFPRRSRPVEDTSAKEDSS